MAAILNNNLNNDLRFKLSPTQLKFVESKAQIVQLMGSMASGKTFVGVVALLAHAKRCGKDIRCALIRDTHRNITTSTIPDIREMLGPWVVFSDSEKKMLIKSTPRVYCDLFGIDDDAGLSKLQGPQYALVWLEEPAPIIEKINAGLPKAVFDMALARASRQQGTPTRVQITQNPADELHWTSVLAEMPREYSTWQNPITKKITVIYKDTFWMNADENTHLDDETRAATYAAFEGDPAKKARYIEGQIATVTLGKKVCPAYNQAIHRSPDVLKVYEDEAFQFWDGWQHPSCIIAQYNPFGQLVIHDVLVGEGLGTKELIDEAIMPLLALPKYKGKISHWRAIGDPSMATADQSTIRQSAAKTIEKAFNTRFENGPKDWAPRREVINASFKRLIGEGIPAVILSNSAFLLHRALRGGWHYKTDNNGNVVGDKPVKSPESHPGDAYAYGVAILMPIIQTRKPKKESSKTAKKVAMSYRGGNYSKKARRVF